MDGEAWLVLRVFQSHPLHVHDSDGDSGGWLRERDLFRVVAVAVDARRLDLLVRAARAPSRPNGSDSEQ
jgi:hypothetical protein